MAAAALSAKAAAWRGNRNGVAAAAKRQRRRRGVAWRLAAWRPRRKEGAEAAISACWRVSWRMKPRNTESGELKPDGWRRKSVAWRRVEGVKKETEILSVPVSYAMYQ